MRGISRHVVRFVQCDDRVLYALKELPPDLAWREYRLLRALEEREMPVVTSSASWQSAARGWRPC